MYKLQQPRMGLTESTVVQRLEDGLYIPFDQENKDYQIFLSWVAEGNTPQPADE
jgi:hypothetical protein